MSDGQSLKQVINDVKVTKLIKAKLNFIASIFKQRLTIEENSIELPSNKKTQKLSKDQIHQAGMRAFEDLLEDYGDVLEALAEHYKRIALTSIYIFLRLNGFRLVASNKETFKYMIDLAEGKISQKDLANWLILNSRPEQAL